MALLTPSKLEKYRVVETSPEADFLEEKAQQVVRKLLEASGEYDPRIHKFKIYVTDEPGLNAWISPDIGDITPIALSKGLWERIGTESKLATIIGHELGHFKFRLEHGSRPNGKIQEMAGDAYGLEYIRKAGYDINEAKEVYHTFPEILNTDARIAQSLEDKHTGKEDRLKQIEAHIGAIQSGNVVEGSVLPLQEDIIEAAGKVKHVPFVEKELTQRGFIAADVPERTRILTELVDEYFKTRTLDDDSCGVRYADLQNALRTELTGVDGFNRDNPQHVDAFNALFERFTVRSDFSPQFNTKRDTFLGTFRTVWNNGQAITDPYMGFQHSIADSFEDLVHADTKEKALDAAKRITEFTKKYNFNNGSILNNVISENSAQKYRTGETKVWAGAQQYATFILPTKESATNALEQNITDKLVPSFAKHLQWLQETQSDDLFYALHATGVYVNDLHPTVSINWDERPNFLASMPISPIESDEYIDEVWKGDTDQKLSNIYDFEFSKDGKEIVGVVQPNEYPRLSITNTPNLTKEQLIASEEKRLKALDAAHRTAIREADWDLLKKMPFTFVDKYKEYFMPELSVVPRGGEVFPAEFVKRLGDLIEGGSELHKNFAKHFFGNSYSMNGKLSAEELDSVREFETEYPRNYVFPESIFSEFVKDPYGFLRSDFADHLTSKTAKRQSTDPGKTLENPRWVGRIAFSNTLKEFYLQEMMPGSPQREARKGTPIYDFIVDMEAHDFGRNYAKNLAYRKTKLEQYKQDEQNNPSEEGRTRIRETEAIIAEAEKTIQAFHDEPRSVMEHCPECALFLLGDGSPLRRDQLRYRISHEFYDYVDIEIDKLKLSDFESEYNKKNNDMNVSVGRTDYEAPMRRYSGADKSSNKDQLDLPFEINVDHPFQKFVRDNKFGLFNAGDRTHYASRSYYYYNDKSLAADDRWLHGDPASFWGYHVPNSQQELLSLFADLNLGIARPLPRIPDGMTLEEVLTEFKRTQLGIGLGNEELNAEVQRVASVVDEIENLPEKRIMQYETLRYLRNNNKPIPFEDFRDILNLSKLGTMFAKDLAPCLSKQAALNCAQDLDPAKPVDHLLKVYREYLSSGVFANDLTLQQAFEASIIERGSSLAPRMRLEIARGLLYRATQDEIDHITQHPDPESVTTSNATIRAIRAAGYTANKGVLPNPKLKEWAIETLAQAEAISLGKDDGSPAYAKKAKAVIDRLSAAICTRGNAREATYRLIEKVEAQKNVAYYVRDKGGEFSATANQFADEGIALYSALHSTIIGREELRKDFTNLLTSPPSQETAREFLDKHQITLNEAFRNIAEIEKARAKKFAEDQNLRIDLDTLSENGLEKYLSEEAKISALLQFHNNFWDQSFEFRTGLISCYLFPTDMTPQDEKSRFMGEAVFSVDKELAGQFQDRNPEDLGRQYQGSPENKYRIIGPIAKAAHLSPEAVREKIDASFSRARDEYKWSRVGDIQNEILEKSLGSSPDRAVAEKIVKAYLSVAEPEYRLLLLSSMMVASYPDGNHQTLSTGRVLDIVLTAFEEAGDKVKQAIHSNPSTPKHIAEPLANSKTATRKPTRPEQVEYLERYGPPQTGSDSDIKRIGGLLGAGSYGVTLGTEKTNGTKTAVTLLRPGSRQRSEIHFNRFLQAAEIVAKEDPKLKPIIAIVRQAANMVMPETDMDIGARQSAQAAENMNKMTVKVDGHEFKYQTVKWLGHGVFRNEKGEIISGYKETEIAPGKHFNELASAEDVRKANRDFELGKITSDQLQSVNQEHTYKIASAKSHLAVGLTQILAGHPFDHDIHGGQIRQDGDNIYKFDDGAVGPLDREGNVITPTKNMKKALKKILTRSLVEYSGKKGVVGVMRDFVAASSEVCRFIPPIRKAITHANDKYDRNLEEQKAAAQARAVENGHYPDLVEVDDPYRGDPRRGIKAAIDNRFGPELFTITSRKTEKYNGASTTKDYLTSVQRGLLALGDYCKVLSPGDFKHVMGSVLQNGQIDPAIMKQGIVARIAKNWLLADREPFEIVQENPDRNHEIDYSHKRTEPSLEQRDYDRNLQEAKVSKALRVNAENGTAMPIAALQGLASTKTDTDVPLAGSLEKGNRAERVIAKQEPRSPSTDGSQRAVQPVVEKTQIKGDSFKVHLDKCCSLIDKGGLIVGFTDAAINRDATKAAVIGGMAAGIHAGMKIVAKTAGVKSVPVAGQIVGGLFAAKDTYDSWGVNTTRAAVSGVETALYSVATVSGAAAAFNFWNPAGWGAGAVAVGAGAAAVTISSAKAVYDNWKTIKGWFGNEESQVQFTPHEAELSTHANYAIGSGAELVKDAKPTYAPTRAPYSMLSAETLANITGGSENISGSVNRPTSKTNLGSISPSQ